MEYSIATFCFGERYYAQTNRMIEHFDKIEDKPLIFIITDNEESIVKRDFVKVRNISHYNKKYNTYANNYYDFDFSVKRYSLKFALENGFTKIILTDSDVIPNPLSFNNKNILECFIPNSVSGQVCYFFEKEIQTGSMLGKRFLHYEQKFNFEFDKSNLWMPEDCIQYIEIEKERFVSFLSTWDRCVEIKDSDNLPNIPAGNIDEMCFSAIYNGLDLNNNSNRHINLLIAKHDKWY